MAKKLDEQRLVERTPYRGVTLTERGRLVALEVLRHHRLLELYLADTLGMPLDVVHDEADGSSTCCPRSSSRKIDEALGFPTHDPHGDPIPDPKLRLDEPRGTLLGDARRRGSRTIVTRVPDGDSDVLALSHRDRDLTGRVDRGHRQGAVRRATHHQGRRTPTTRSPPSWRRLSASRRGLRLAQRSIPTQDAAAPARSASPRRARRPWASRVSR